MHTQNKCERSAEVLRVKEDHERSVEVIEVKVDHERSVELTETIRGVLTNRNKS